MSLRAVLLIALGLSGCSALSPPGPSHVARGEYYAAGKPEYDSFFIELHRKQVALLAAPAEPAEARKNLTATLGLTPDASDDSLNQRLEQETKALESRGLRLRLEVPEPSSASLDASATLYSSEQSTSTPLRTLLPQEATRLLRSRQRLLAAKAELERLRVNGIELEGSIDAVFRTEGPWKRDEVRANLSDGQKLITLMQARAQQVVELDQKLLDVLTRAATSDRKLGTSEVNDPTAEDQAKPKQRSGRARASTHPRPAPSALGSSAAPGKPRGQPAAGDDEAAPKPVPGNAPAEIEP